MNSYIIGLNGFARVGVQMIKLLTVIVTTIIIAFIINYLYSLKLGAIPFLILAIVFFVLAFSQIKKEIKNKKQKEKQAYKE